MIMPQTKSTASASAVRRDAMQVLASAPAQEIARLFSNADFDGDARMLRRPETGLVTVRGRIGGGGAPFNVGEATVTRASVRLASGEVGHAYALGRDGEKARICAVIDALLQRPGEAEAVEAVILGPLREAQGKATAKRQAETAATKVEFFTMVRGED
ncbi:phosphonate C-P lyase system protein PhnG [Aliihoeflea aestuarii]|jgi:alpha-D-ribose 1-methylphosphonate 5-triphosphate synthase subunit PhnG|uniref:phosphonate C-P lyase system protein PhnG n=1 Tax=Aliihoeflea aestuarii TaxID=453840 RepID=UPI0035580DAF